MSEIPERLRAALSGSYAIERELGRGGMATVYLARDLKHRRQVAVKVLHPELAASIGAERFLREIEIVAALNHPHILALHDSGEADGFLYYVMPYVPGESLRDRLDREGQLPLDDAITIVEEVADGLAHAHSYGIVHRDIKPANILLSGGHAVIADFGVARAASAGQEGITGTGLAIGTPGYMSPEQAGGRANLDGRSDVYSVGCMLYEMLAGQPPFTGPTPQAILARHSIDPPPPLLTIRPTIPEPVNAAIMRSMAKVPADRFATVAQFAEALTQEATPHAAPRVSTQPTVVMEPARRRRIPLRWLAGAAVAAGLIAAAAVSLPPLFEGPERPRLVVLPFENFGPPEDQYFADGMTEEITSRLAGITHLGVIARTTAMYYRGAAKSIDMIAEELDVTYAVEGSVRWGRGEGTGDRVAVRARLIDVRDGTQMWSTEHSVDAGDIFGVQQRIAEQTVEALGIALLEPERDVLAGHPTENVEAYDYYLRGRDYATRSWERRDVEAALAMYQRAADLDPSFAGAMAQIGRTHTWIHRLGYDRTAERLAAAKAAVDSALALDSGLAEAHLAEGLYRYWGHLDYDRAMSALAIARRLQPGNAEIHQQIGNIRRRQGLMREAIASYAQAAELDPRSFRIWFNLADTHAMLREYGEAARFVERTLALVPDFLDALTLEASLAIHRGDVAAAASAVRTAVGRVPPTEWRPMTGFWLNGLTRILDAHGGGVLDAVAPGMLGLDTALYHLVQAERATRARPPGDARAHYDSARTVLERLREERPDAHGVHGTLGIAYAGLDRAADAVNAARRAVELLPVSRDALDGPDWIVNLAVVHRMVGDREGAIDQLELALAIPSRLSPSWLRLDPVWDALRDDPAFRRLLNGPVAPAGHVTP